MVWAVRLAEAEGCVADQENCHSGMPPAGALLQTRTAAGLHSAAQRGKLDEVKRCMQVGGIDVNAIDHCSGETALHAVCSASCNSFTEQSRVAVAKLLLKAGANPNSCGKFDWTPLHYACWRGHPKIVGLLLKAGADPEARTARRTPSCMPSGIAASAGHTPRDYARDAGHTDCVLALDDFQVGYIPMHAPPIYYLVACLLTCAIALSRQLYTMDLVRCNTMNWELAAEAASKHRRLAPCPLGAFSVLGAGLIAAFVLLGVRNHV